jgi:predicted DCC family thiol-disulfide oxidoreductase YuxK
MVLLRESDGALFTHTDAFFELARVLGWPWRLACVTAIIPRHWRDAIYQWLADRRRHLLGNDAACRLPGAELVSRLRP